MPFHCRYTRHRAQLASPYVAALLSIRMGLAAAERCATFAVSHGTRGCAAGKVGKMHEDLSHIFLAGGDRFKCRMIGSGKEFILELPPSKDVEVRLQNKQGSFSGIASGLVWQWIFITLPSVLSALRHIAVPLSGRYSRSQLGGADKHAVVIWLHS